MKTNITTKSIMLLLIALITAVFICAGAFGLNKNADADAEVFQMVNSASIRLDGNGLRFKVKMNETVKDMINFDDVNLYFIIMPEKYLSQVGSDYQMAITRESQGDFDKEDSHCVYVKVNNNIYSGGDGYYYANGGIANVKEANLKESFVAIACIETYSGGAYSYRYADIVDGQDKYPATHLYNMVNKAMLESSEDYYSYIAEYYDWYGQEDYPVYIDEQAQYNEFAAKINKGYNFSSFNVEIASTVRVSGEGVTKLVTGKTLPAKTTRYCTVKFYDAKNGALIGEEVIKIGEKAEKIANPVKQSDGRKEYTFLYWEYDGRQWDFDEDVVEDDIELFAVWEEKSYSIDFEL